MVMMMKVTVISTMALSTNLAHGKLAAREEEGRQRGRSWVGGKEGSDFSFHMCCISDLLIFYFYLFRFLI